jgi:hypothetical protein
MPLAFREAGVIGLEELIEDIASQTMNWTERESTQMLPLTLRPMTPYVALGL